MDNGLPQNKPVTLKDVEQINKEKHHKNMQNKIHRIDDSYQLPGEKPMSTADKPTSKFMDAMTQVLANEAEIMEKKKMTKGDIAALAGDPKNIDAEDFAALRAKKHLKKEEVEPKKTKAQQKKELLNKITLQNIQAKADREREAANKRDGYISAGGGAIHRESYEPLAELSKSTLKNYIKKASGADGGSDKSLPTLAAATGRNSERSQVAAKAGDMETMRKERGKADKSFDKSWNRRKGIGMAADRLAKEEVEMNERSLSPAEKDAVEVNVMSMKKNLAGFKARYGKDAKSVMYATATKQAKKD